MNYVAFKQWLQDEKNMSVRSAMDVVSRCKRIIKMIEKDSIDETTITNLVRLDAYENMSSFIKSQLKRAATLYIEFMATEKMDSISRD